MKGKGKKKRKSQAGSQEEKTRKRRNSLTDSPVTSSASEGGLSADSGQSSQYSSTDLEVQLNSFDCLLSCNESFGAMGPYDRNSQFWASHLSPALRTGNYQEFVRILLKICSILKKNRVRVSHDVADMFRDLMPLVVKQLSNQEKQSTVFHTIAKVSRSCVSTDHGLCKLIELIADSVGKSAVKWLLTTADKYAKRTPIHIACFNNHECVVRLLLEYGADPNVRDVNGRTAVFYAIHKDNYTLLNLLAWYGADFGLYSLIKADMTFVAGLEVPHVKSYIKRRQNCLEKKFCEFVKQCSGGSITLQPLKACSSLLLVRPFNRFENSKLSDHAVVQRNFVVDISKNGAVDKCMFIVPFVYVKQDVDASGDLVQIRRYHIQGVNGGKPKLIPRTPVVCNNESGACMEDLLEADMVHNGHMYAYRLPQALKTVDRLTVSMYINLEVLSSEERDTVKLMVQIYDIHNMTVDPKKND